MKAALYSCFPRSVPTRFEQRCSLHCRYLSFILSSYTSTDHRVCTLLCMSGHIISWRRQNCLNVLERNFETTIIAQNTRFASSLSCVFYLAAYQSSVSWHASDINRVTRLLRVGWFCREFYIYLPVYSHPRKYEGLHALAFIHWRNFAIDLK